MIFFERRRHPRILKTKSIEFIKIADKKEVINCGVMLDLSMSGIGVETDFMLLEGQPVILKGVSDDETLIYGVVCWCQKQTGLYRSGIRFYL
ncbi:MAG: PilZ domain-containing protein [Thermodesulfovibrionales bacterium]|nr:PilZ domain-containing protein [Thermodesulfovibrionales bacterium]